jgi:hypothetical protein
VRLDGTLAALAGRASIGDASMLGMLVSGRTVYGRTTSPVDLFAHDVDRAQRRAERAESDAEFAISFAYAAVEEAEYAVLDATLARMEAALRSGSLAQTAR